MDRDESKVLEAVHEKDIDLMVVEELHLSEEFCEWFCRQVGINYSDLEGAWRSVMTSSGESDVEAIITGLEGGRHVLLVENKIEESQQERQAERYLERGENYLQEDSVDDYEIVLLAPKKYLTARIEEKYPNIITYDQLKDFFVERDAARYPFRQRILEQAIERARRGYDKSTDEETTEFWKFFERKAQRGYPSLEFELPKSKASGTTWQSFRPSDLPDGVRIRLKADRGLIDLELGGAADYYQELVGEVEPRLEADMWVHKTGQSVSIGLEVPAIEEPQRPRRKENELEEILDSATRLHEWFKENGEVIQELR